MANPVRSRHQAWPAVRGSAASPWRMAEAEELRHALENRRAEQALQVPSAWRAGFSTAALAAASGR